MCCIIVCVFRYCQVTKMYTWIVCKFNYAIFYGYLINIFPLSILESCEEWYELMVGKLLYTCPLVMSTDYELCYTAEWSRRELARFRGEDTDEAAGFAMDELLLAALRNDFMGVIQVCRQVVQLQLTTIVVFVWCNTLPNIILYRI